MASPGRRPSSAAALSGATIGDHDTRIVLRQPQPGTILVGEIDEAQPEIAALRRLRIGRARYRGFPGCLAKARGCRWYELGMAPLSGLPGHRLAPLSTKLGRLLYRHGGSFYNFEGLRAFEDRFDPVWEPKYLLYAGGSLPRVLADVAALVADGWIGMIKK